MFQGSTFSHLTCVLSLCAITALATPTAAVASTPIYQQPFSETAAGGWFASADTGAVQMDSFVLNSNATISSVSWYGVDLNELVGWDPVNPLTFSVTIYSDKDGLPGDALSISSVGNFAGATLTGSQLLGLNLYSYQAELATPFQAAAGAKYWLEITDTAANNDWFWASGSGGDGTHVNASVIDPFAVQADDLSFSLTGTVTAVPEPGSTPMLVLGGGCLLILSKLKRRRARR